IRLAHHLDAFPDDRRASWLSRLPDLGPAEFDELQREAWRARWAPPATPHGGASPSTPPGGEEGPFRDRLATGHPAPATSTPRSPEEDAERRQREARLAAAKTRVGHTRDAIRTLRAALA